MSDLVYQFLISIDKGRLVENLIFLGVLIAKIGPHLRKIEENLQKLTDQVVNGFKEGEKRFERIERRVERLEDGKPIRQQADA